MSQCLFLCQKSTSMKLKFTGFVFSAIQLQAFKFIFPLFTFAIPPHSDISTGGLLHGFQAMLSFLLTGYKLPLK
ncbi:hypothetical protein EB796_017298 [Bugula neritina]|uniref:Uncharacterized protein n=1 Tax=Bugula neritina TaxID=10212 RepID=A0A7J7JFI7_BUGNE|nr:hypothetical protein EB796_017298 [Bugula neritina]